MLGSALASFSMRLRRAACEPLPSTGRLASASVLLVSLTTFWSEATFSSRRAWSIRTPVRERTSKTMLAVSWMSCVRGPYFFHWSSSHLEPA